MGGWSYLGITSKGWVVQYNIPDVLGLWWTFQDTRHTYSLVVLVLTLRVKTLCVWCCLRSIGRRENLFGNIFSPHS